MPFKTKKKKLAAKKHRIEISTSGAVHYTRGEPDKLYDNGEQKGAVSESYSAINIRTELVRILVLAGVIIGLQLALKLSNLAFLN